MAYLWRASVEAGSYPRRPTWPAREESTIRLTPRTKQRTHDTIGACFPWNAMVSCIRSYSRTLSSECVSCVEGLRQDVLLPSRGDDSYPVGVLGDPSAEAWANRDHSWLILDFDDTLFPTTAIKERFDLSGHVGLRSQLRDQLLADAPSAERHYFACHEAAKVFLEEASKFAQIVVVTLAHRDHFESKVTKFWPEFGDLLSNHRVIFAREHMTPSMLNSEAELTQRLTQAEANADSFNTAWRNLWTNVKRAAIMTALEESRSQGGKKLMNALSIGDSIFERDAARIACREHAAKEDGSADGREMLRMKTVMMLEDPTLGQITAQLRLLKSWIPSLVCKNTDLDVEIASDRSHYALIEQSAIGDALFLGGSEPPVYKPGRGWFQGKKPTQAKNTKKGQTRSYAPPLRQ